MKSFILILALAGTLGAAQTVKPIQCHDGPCMVQPTPACDDVCSVHAISGALKAETSKPPTLAPKAELTPNIIRNLALEQPDGPRCDKANWPRTDIYCHALESVVGEYFLKQAKEAAIPLPASNVLVCAPKTPDSKEKPKVVPRIHPNGDCRHKLEDSDAR